MSSPPAPVVTATPDLPAPPSRPRVTLLALRVVVVLTTILIVAQPFLAGAYLQGEFDALGLHSANAILLAGLFLLQIAVSLAYWLIGRGSVAPVVVSTVMFVLVVFQLGMGFARIQAVHIPLGVAVVGIAVVTLARVFSEQASVGRPRRSAGVDAGAAAAAGTAS